MPSLLKIGTMLKKLACAFKFLKIIDATKELNSPLISLVTRKTQQLSFTANIECIQVRSKAYEVESNTAYIILKLGLQFTGFPTNAYKSDLSS